MEIELRALEPLAGYIDIDEFPLAEFLPADTTDTIFEALHLVDPVITTSGSSVIFDGGVAWEGEIGLQLPGTDLVSVILGAGGAGWTALWCRMTVGPAFELVLVDASVTVRVSEDLLTDVATRGPAEITVLASIRFTADGAELLDPVTVDLPDTGLTIAASGVGIVSGPGARPGFVLATGDAT